MNSICCIILSLAYLPQVIQSYNLKKGGLLWRILLRLRGDFEWFWNQSNLHLYTIEIHNPPGIPSNYQRMIGVTILSFGEPGSLQMLVRGRSLWSCISARFQVSSVYFSMYFHVSSLRESQPLTHLVNGFMRHQVLQRWFWCLPGPRQPFGSVDGYQGGSQTKQSKKPQNMTWLSTQSANKKCNNTFERTCSRYIWGYVFKKVVKQPIFGYDSAIFELRPGPPHSERKVQRYGLFRVRKLGSR